MSTSTPPLLSAQELADVLNVRLTRVYELIHARQIPFTKVGRRQVRFDPVVIRQWLDARTTPAKLQASGER